MQSAEFRVRSSEPFDKLMVVSEVEPFKVWKGIKSFLRHTIPLILLFAAPLSAPADETLILQPLIDEALQNNPEIQAAGARWQAMTHRAPQAESLPDPMIMVGYQNDGFDRYTFGKMEGSMWMYSVAQMVPFPGKRRIKGEMATRDAEGSGADFQALRQRTAARVKELYYDLFQTDKDIDLVRERTALFTRIEEAALARYATGMAPQQEVLMAQAEKYMLIEKEEMLKQKRQSLAAMLNAALGRNGHDPLGRPGEPSLTDFPFAVEELIDRALTNSPELRSRRKMADAADAGVAMARKEYFPDVTLAGTVFKRSGDFEDMWSITATFNIPLFFRSRQGQALAEAKSVTLSAHREIEAVKLMLISGVRDNYAMVKAAEKLADLYRQGLIPKTYQDFEAALAGYVAGKVEAITVISRLKALLDFESQYWAQIVSHEKAIARIEEITGSSL